MLSLSSILSEGRLRWFDHVHRMRSERIPKALLFGELATGLRKRGRPCLRYKDVCKRDMLQANIDPKTWESLAEERTLLRSKVLERTRTAEAIKIAREEERRARKNAGGRGERETSSSLEDGKMP